MAQRKRMTHKPASSRPIAAKASSSRPKSGLFPELARCRLAVPVPQRVQLGVCVYLRPLALRSCKATWDCTVQLITL